MIRSFNSVENFSAKWRMRTTATPSWILGPLISQEVIERGS